MLTEKDLRSNTFWEIHKSCSNSKVVHWGTINASFYTMWNIQMRNISSLHRSILLRNSADTEIFGPIFSQCLIYSLKANKDFINSIICVESLVWHLVHCNHNIPRGYSETARFSNYFCFVLVCSFYFKQGDIL